MPGGRRAGAGRPTKASLDATQREASSAEAQAIAISAAPLAMAFLKETMSNPDADPKDRMRAAQILLENGIGKPNVKAANTGDTSITMVALIPRPGMSQETEEETEEEADGEEGVPDD